MHASRIERAVLPYHRVVGRFFSKQRLVCVEDLVIDLAKCLAAGEYDHVATLDENAEALLDDILPELGGPSYVPDVLVVRLGSVGRVDNDCRDRLVLYLLENIETVGVDHDAIGEAGRDRHRRNERHKVLDIFLKGVCLVFFSRKLQGGKTKLTLFLCLFDRTGNPNVPKVLCVQM